MDRNIYQCPACGSKRITRSKRSAKENLMAASIFAGILYAIGFLIWPWLGLVGIVLGLIVYYQMPVAFYCLSCRRRWKKEQIKIIGQVPKSL